jgi:hypothetical protein
VRALAFLALAACGRIHFGLLSPGDALAGDAPPPTGPVGQRYLATFASPNFLIVAGVNGEAVAAADFVQMIAVNGQPYAALGLYLSVFAARFSTTGALTSNVILDATGFCDMRGLAMIGDSVLAVGYTEGTTMPAYGPCAIQTGRQDPVGFTIDAQGNVTQDLHFVSGSTNAQAWDVALLADGTLAVSGDYGSDLTIGSTKLPTAPTDNAFYVRVPQGAGEPLWATPLAGAAGTFGGPVAADGLETCLVGGYTSPATLFGMSLPAIGAANVVVARVAADGTPVFVRGVGSTGNDDPLGDFDVLATADGGCLVSFAAGGDVTIDGTTFLASDGAAVLLRLDKTGALVHGYSLPSAMALANVGGYVFGALDVAAPITTPFAYTPQGSDVAIVELDASDMPHFIDAVGGPGTQVRQRFGAISAIAFDALALSVVSSGALMWAGTGTDSGATTIQALAVLGVAP